MHERIAEALRQIPGDYGYEIARTLGVSLVTLRQWRHGVTTPSPRNLRKIADVSGVSIEWIRNGRTA